MVPRPCLFGLPLLRSLPVTVQAMTCSVDWNISQSRITRARARPRSRPSPRLDSNLFHDCPSWGVKFRPARPSKCTQFHTPAETRLRRVYEAGRYSVNAHGIALPGEHQAYARRWPRRCKPHARLCRNGDSWKTRCGAHLLRTGSRTGRARRDRNFTTCEGALSVSSLMHLRHKTQGARSLRLIFAKRFLGPASSPRRRRPYTCRKLSAPEGDVLITIGSHLDPST